MLRRLSSEFRIWWSLTPRERLVRRIARSNRKDSAARKRLVFDAHIANASRF